MCSSDLLRPAEEVGVEPLATYLPTGPYSASPSCMGAIMAVADDLRARTSARTASAPTRAHGRGGPVGGAIGGGGVAVPVTTSTTKAGAAKYPSVELAGDRTRWPPWVTEACADATMTSFKQLVKKYPAARDLTQKGKSVCINFLFLGACVDGDGCKRAHVPKPAAA